MRRRRAGRSTWPRGTSIRIRSFTRGRPRISTGTSTTGNSNQTDLASSSRWSGGRSASLPNGTKRPASSPVCCGERTVCGPALEGVRDGRDVLRRPAGVADPPAGKCLVHRRGPVRPADPGPQQWLGHDAGVLALEVLVPPAQRLLEEADRRAPAAGRGPGTGATTARSARAPSPGRGARRAAGRCRGTGRASRPPRARAPRWRSSPRRRCRGASRRRGSGAPARCGWTGRPLRAASATWSVQPSPTYAGSGGRAAKASMVAARACMSTARTEPPM